MVKIKYGKDQISFQVDEEDPVSVPSRLASQRFYIGNNCLMDTSYSNDGSAFCLDLQSLTTNANRKKSFIDF
jgi:hypothetical protein